MEARLHKLGYTYNGPHSLYGLTYPEIERAVHGDNLLEEAKHDSSKTKNKAGANRTGNLPNEQERRAMEKFKEENDLK